MPTIPTQPKPLPQYNPSVLVLDVMAVLGRAGIAVEVDARNSATAVTAAADLLRALHVMPATAPRATIRPRDPRS